VDFNRGGCSSRATSSEAARKSAPEFTPFRSIFKDVIRQRSEETDVSHRQDRSQLFSPATAIGSRFYLAASRDITARCEKCQTILKSVTLQSMRNRAQFGADRRAKLPPKGADKLTLQPFCRAPFSARAK
jgi:hypothetical protein